MAHARQEAFEKVKNIILTAKEKAYSETDFAPEPHLTKKIKWPVDCVVGPGLEGAIACESKIGYVNGAKGMLIYRGYDIFDLCAYSTFEEVSYLLIHGKMPKQKELETFKVKLKQYSHLLDSKRLLMSFPIEQMNAMAGMRLGTNLMRQKQTYRDYEKPTPRDGMQIATDEDSIPMETLPKGEADSIYRFTRKQFKKHTKKKDLVGAEGRESAYHVISGVNSICGTIARVRAGYLPLEPIPELSHAGNLLYMMTGREPTPLEERIMDVCLILHADHGMNASTFACLVVASTLSDIYFSVGSGIAALNGPLHGGANEQVMEMLSEVKSIKELGPWFDRKMEQKEKMMGFGHRVYKAYDPRARVLGPLAELLAQENPPMLRKYKIAKALEKKVIATLGKEKKIFPNVDYYSGLVYASMGIPTDMFTPIFAVARVSGWTARILEYLQKNRIFRPRAIYTGAFDKEYVPMEKR
jgi:citrate synthase